MTLIYRRWNLLVIRFTYRQIFIVFICLCEYVNVVFIFNSNVLFIFYIGLLHDVGHGPFSHMFEREFLPRVLSGSNWWVTSQCNSNRSGDRFDGDKPRCQNHCFQNNLFHWEITFFLSIEVFIWWFSDHMQFSVPKTLLGTLVEIILDAM